MSRSHRSPVHVGHANFRTDGAEPIEGAMKVARSKSLPRRLGDEAGFLLVEILVSASILLVVSAGTLTALDASDRLAGNQQKRAIAANVAQAEIERVRSLPIEDVARISGTKDFVESGTTYQITSTSKWVTDGSDQPDCSTRSGGLDYMRLTTSVGWVGMKTAAPISITTLITPSSRSANSDKGSLSVQISRADGVTGADGIAVKLTGPESPTETTNENGCVVFPFIAAGSYKVSFQKTGWVDNDNVNAVNRQVTVSGGNTSKLAFLYDLAGTTSVSRFYARREGTTASPSTTLPASGTYADADSEPESLVLYNGVQTKVPFLVPLPGGASSWDGKNQPLFPSKTPYAVYAGKCTTNAPTGSDLASVNISPNTFTNTGAVQLPSLNLVVFSGKVTGGAVTARTDWAPGAKVSFSDGCGGIYHRDTELLPPSGQPGRPGRLADPGFPYTAGGGTLCVQWTNGRRFLRENVSNTDMSNSPTRIPIYMGNDLGGNVATTGNYANGTCAF